MFRPVRAALTAALLLMAPGAASAHFLWIVIDSPKESREGTAQVHAFLNETPNPAGPEFLKFVKDVTLTVDGQPLPSTLREETLDARWAGVLPRTIDATRDLGPMTRGGTTYRLVYTARAQTAPAAIEDAETGDMLRARLIADGGKNRVQILFDGKTLPNARIKVYPDSGEARELTTDDRGVAEVAGLAEGTTALWANWADGKAGEAGGEPISETRYYASLTVRPRGESKADRSPTTIATMLAPAVNSFGGAVLGDWLYIYSGHVGRTHQYSVETTSRHFRRLNLKDRSTWEDLPMSRDVQGVALVSDGRYLYRVGGMSARNQPDHEHDLYSVAEFSRFDPETKTWTDLAPMPVARSTHDAVVIGRKVYAVGGWTMNGVTEDSIFLDDMVAFDLDDPEAGWQPIAQPFPRRALSVAEAGGKLYVLGGLNDSLKVERRVDVYNPAKNSWSLGPDLPEAAKNDGFGTSAFGIDGRPYFSGVAGRVFRLDAPGTGWEAIGDWAFPRITHRVLPGPDHTLLAVGGNTKGKQVAEIEAISLPSSMGEAPNAD